MRALVLVLVLGCNRDALPPSSEDLRLVDLAGPRDLASPPIDLAALCVATPAAITGTTSSGTTFDGAYAWAWYTGGDCDEQPNLHVAADPDGTLTSGPWIDVALGYRLGDQEVMVYYFADGQSLPIAARGFASLTRAEPLASTAEVRLEGTLVVNDAGLKLSGTFSARRCQPLDRFCV